MMQSRLAAYALLGASMFVCGCGGSTPRAVFHPSDPTFREIPGPPPRAYLDADVDAVPRVKLRSVGIIEVRVSEGRGGKRAAEIAIEKGRQLGCWILVEHSAFPAVQSRASVAFGAEIYLAHGGAPHVAAPNPPRTFEFDCVVRDDAMRARFDRRDAFSRWVAR